MPNKIEEKAIATVIEYLTKKGYHVTNVNRNPNSDYRGFDLIAKKLEENHLKIEVKGCTQEWGIPDPYVTEFDSERRLVADFLYVVYFLNDEQPKLCIIPRDAIKPEHIKPKSGYRISSRFKKR